MDLPDYPTEDLARLRMYECQGTLIGGMVVAGTLGMSAEEYGYQMMMHQGIRWERLSGDLEKIARIFTEHFQVTYGFGNALQVRLDGDRLEMTMPSISEAARGQLEHWRVSPEQYEDIQRGFWRSLSENAGVEVQLEFSAEAHRGQLSRRAA